MSNLYSPNLNKGGAANATLIIHIIQIHGEVQKHIFVSWMCQDLSRRTTDRYLTMAIPVIVNNELIPIQ